jgi:hypothetical protein
MLDILPMGLLFLSSERKIQWMIKGHPNGLRITTSLGKAGNAAFMMFLN